MKILRPALLSSLIAMASLHSFLSAQNPVFDGADPHAIIVDDEVWVYPTHGHREHFYAFSSPDLINWTQHGPILNFADIDWIPEGKHAWAPGIMEHEGKYYLYYSVGPKPSHIGVAVADSPAGPFVDSGRALLSDNGEPGFEAIDAMVFIDPADGTPYFYAGGSAGATLRVFELNDDLVSFKREIEVETPRYFTEGAFIHYHDGIYHFTYSRGYWRDATYHVHHSTAPGPTGPWTYRGVILESDERHKGPGHHSVIQNPHSKEWYIVYHRWNDREDSGPYRGSRSTAIDRLEHGEDGVIHPIVMTDEGVTDWKTTGDDQVE